MDVLIVNRSLGFLIALLLLSLLLMEDDKVNFGCQSEVAKLICETKLGEGKKFLLRRCDIEVMIR